MVSNSFKINECDKCVYTKMMPKGYVLVCLYVDDMLIIGSTIELIMTTKRMLTSHFDMKDMGEADVILGIKISKTSTGLVLSQSHYIEKTLNKFLDKDETPVKIPVDIKCTSK